MTRKLSRDCDGPCYYCHERTITATENVDVWPVWFAHADGVLKPHHIKCVRQRLDSLAKFQLEIKPFLNQLTRWPKNGVQIKDLQLYAGRLLNILGER